MNPQKEDVDKAFTTVKERLSDVKLKFSGQNPKDHFLLVFYFTGYTNNQNEMVLSDGSTLNPT